MEPDDDLPEARVIAIGDSVEDGPALFAGPLEDAIAFVHALPTAQQADVAIVTDGRVYDPREV